MDTDELRSQLISFLRGDLLGPRFDHISGEFDRNEVLEIAGSPDRYYMVGTLQPLRDDEQPMPESFSETPILSGNHSCTISQTEQNNIDENQVGNSDRQYMQPSSMGVTVCPSKHDSLSNCLFVGGATSGKTNNHGKERVLKGIRNQI